jgi:hypothetical protein
VRHQQPLEVADRRGVPTEAKLRLPTVLHRGEPYLGQPRHLGRGPAGRLGIGQRDLVPPQFKARAQVLDTPPHHGEVGAGARRATTADALLEPPRVDGLGRD